MTQLPVLHPSLRRRHLESITLDDTERGWTLIALTLATAAAYWSNAASFLLVGDISGNLGASFDEGVWLITTYITAYAIGIALSHRLTSFLGNRRLLSLSCLAFAVGSLGQACSTNMPTFLVFRAIAGVAGGAFLPRSLVFLTHRYERPNRVVPMRNFAIGFLSIGMVIAPVASGWLSDNISWRMAFAAPIPLAIIAAYLFHTFAAKHWIEVVEEHRPDVAGIILLIAGVTTLQVLLDRGEINGWFESNGICALAGAALITNGAFLVWQFLPHNKHPLINAYHIFDRGMLAGVVLAVSLGMGLSGSTYVLYQYLREVETHSALQTGVLMGVVGLSIVLTMGNVPLIVRMLLRFGGRKLIFVALVCQMIAMFLLMKNVTSDTPDRYLWIPLVLSGIFMGIMIPCLSLAAFAKMDNQSISNARTLYYCVRELGASLGVTLTDILVDRRTSLHSQRLLEEAFRHGVPTNTSYAALSGAVMRQALVLSYQDVFLVMGAIALFTCFLLPLLPVPPKRTPVATPSASALAPTGSK